MTESTTASASWQTPALVPLINTSDAAGKTSFSIREFNTNYGSSFGPS